MILYFLYDKKGKAKMMSKTPFKESNYDPEKLTQVQIQVTPEQRKQLKKPFEKKILGGELVIEDFPKEKEKKNMIERIKKTKDIEELKDIILEMI